MLPSRSSAPGGRSSADSAPQLAAERGAVRVEQASRSHVDAEGLFSATQRQDKTFGEWLSIGVILHTIDSGRRVSVMRL